MFKKIKNPYNGLPGYNCFGCSRNNAMGLQMEFYYDGEKLISKWTPQPQYQGYNNILHGGIQATLMDEVASWLVYATMHTSGVTSRLDIKYKKPVATDKGAITLQATLKEIKKNLAYISIVLMNADEVVCAEAEAVFFTYPREYCIKNLGFPEDAELYED